MAQDKKSSGAKVVSVAPDSVRVWRGFRLPSLKQDKFFEKLGSIFCPGTVQIQTPVGLTAYLPSVLPAKKHAAAPDEIAVVFYEYQNAYHEAKETVGGRAYSDLHGLVFDLTKSLSGFPDRFIGEVEQDGRYYLFDQPVDWQHGIVNVFVGVRSGDPQSFLSTVAKWLKQVQERGGPDGAIASASLEYVVYWEHWASDVGADGSQIPSLAASIEPVYQQSIEPYPLPEGLWEPYKGVEINGGESFNFQFERRSATS